ncbi:hypothetical protein [Candidatus Solirubrobacter pratensis]|uniref:hypothetical protein n=1 Tax=Candidatus Solirubrobacter pratensis TaxID=1298857 RepID=UPI00040098A2|nr:hypothetical protein [Candidatus Solirubrobacter pratensis]
MDLRVARVAVAGVALLLFVGHQVASSRGAAGRSDTEHELTPEVRARTVTFASGVSAADRAWVLDAIASARPEAQQLIAAVDGLVTIGVVAEPSAPFVGVAKAGSDDILLNIAYLDGERKQDRPQTVLHELGHIIDFELVPDDEMERLAAAIPSSGGCFSAETGDCTAPEERFADTFAKWALRGAVSTVGAGYGVSAPASLEQWGAPLGALAAQQSIQK